MKELICENRVPYGGLYKLDRREIGMVGRGTTFDMLEGDVLKYRRANGIPVGLGFKQELIDALCQEYPDECEDTDPNLLPAKPERLRLQDVITGTITMVTFIAAGKPIVSKEEADRRSEICAGCKYNLPVPHTCGGGCGALRNIVMKVVGPQESKRHADLGGCQICKCYLQAAVWLPLELQVKALPESQRAQFAQIPWCWKRSVP